ncbi:MAG: prephenate dehydrogenase/arogenate dehydrogenase family protein, partial [Gemmatimonadetes bacterium]|nr:prephenate dehydrogenase/arogenate dehydrogenase family protein [Gemmatimonadota bacterium]
LLATCLVEMVGQLDEESDEQAFLTLAAGGFRDMTRIASSPFAPVWRDICGTNPDCIRSMIEQYQQALSSLAARVGTNDLEQSFAFANRVRDGIPRDTKGFINRLSEVLVVCEDRPGVIAEIATAMAEENVNINDIEVVKVREGMGGTLRLGFDDDDVCRRALGVLQRLGYEARRL